MERVRRREWLGSIAPTDRRIRENSNSTFSQNPKNPTNPETAPIGHTCVHQIAGTVNDREFTTEE